MNINKITKILRMLSKFNLHKRYKEHKDVMKLLSEHNTMNISEFMNLNSNEKFMVLFSLAASTKIRMGIQMKLLYIILITLLGSIGATGLSLI